MEQTNGTVAQFEKNHGNWVGELRALFEIAEGDSQRLVKTAIGLRPEINDYDIRGAMGCGCTIGVPSKCTQKSC